MNITAKIFPARLPDIGLDNIFTFKNETDIYRPLKVLIFLALIKQDKGLDDK